MKINYNSSILNQINSVFLKQYQEKKLIILKIKNYNYIFILDDMVK